MWNSNTGFYYHQCRLWKCEPLYFWSSLTINNVRTGFEYIAIRKRKDLYFVLEFENTLEKNICLSKPQLARNK